MHANFILVKGTSKLPYLMRFGLKEVLAESVLKRNVMTTLMKKKCGKIQNIGSFHSFSFMFLEYFLYKTRL